MCYFLIGTPRPLRKTMNPAQCLACFMLNTSKHMAMQGLELILANLTGLVVGTTPKRKAILHIPLPKKVKVFHAVRPTPCSPWNHTLTHAHYHSVLRGSWLHCANIKCNMHPNPKKVSPCHLFWGVREAYPREGILTFF